MQEEAFPSSHNALPFMSSLLPSLLRDRTIYIPEPVFLNLYGTQEPIPRNEFRQPM